MLGLQVAAVLASNWTQNGKSCGSRPPAEVDVAPAAPDVVEQRLQDVEKRQEGHGDTEVSGVATF